MSVVEEPSDAENAGEERKRENSPATTEDSSSSSSGDSSVLLAEEPPVKRARVEKGGDGLVRDLGQGRSGALPLARAHVLQSGHRRLRYHQSGGEGKEEGKDERGKEEAEAEWIDGLTAVNKALLRAFLAAECDEIRADLNGKELRKPAISLLFEILAGTFKCFSTITTGGVAGAFSASLVLGPSTISSCEHKNKKDAKNECARRAIRALLTMSVDSVREVKKEAADDTVARTYWDAVVKRKAGTVVKTEEDTVARTAWDAAVTFEELDTVARKTTVFKIEEDTVAREGTVSIEGEQRKGGCFGYQCDVQRPRADGAMAQTRLSNLMQEQAYALFHKLAETCPAAANTHRVLAAMFLRDQTTARLHCVSLATGNKCIKATSLSFDGCAVNDCHAEILTRRGLVRWLYTQVQLSLTSPGKSALVREQGEEGGKLRLRKRFSLHLFISTAPCGDGRVYQFGSTKNKDYRNVGRLRHKIEDGEGTVLGEAADERLSIDSFAMGQRLRTMSCSDKVLKWNVMGLQGALLSHFLHPIYLSSLALAHFTRESCIARACYGRVARFKPSEPEYTVNSSLVLHRSTFVLPTTVSRARPKSSNVSANWNATDGEVELIDTRTGRALQAKDTGLGAVTSRLSKISMLTRFAALTPGAGSIKYKDVKRSATDYSKTQFELIRYLEEEAKLGQWQSKPNDFSQVEVE
ncbi:adr-2 [Pristionchus pacificus]|uniref:Adr-2 n=1 Tax=Pristionchus pacificus TaxID=54126 RepID=A0A2A6CE55_PRIPA|nr:adr-2 [Pristionchus pacificus]|eukprot:PDM76399.1 adr-2 [Pristionchus pacificus]